MCLFRDEKINFSISYFLLFLNREFNNIKSLPLIHHPTSLPSNLFTDSPSIWKSVTIHIRDRWLLNKKNVPTAIIYTFIMLFKSQETNDLSIKDFWEVISPLVTLAIGYLFGKGS